jgi:hypothetical protein
MINHKIFFKKNIILFFSLMMVVFLAKSVMAEDVIKQGLGDPSFKGSLFKVNPLQKGKKARFVCYGDNKKTRGHMEPGSVYPVETVVSVPVGSILVLTVTPISGDPASMKEVVLQGGYIYDLRDMNNIDPTKFDPVKLVLVVPVKEGPRQAMFVKEYTGEFGSVENVSEINRDVDPGTHQDQTRMKEQVSFVDGMWLLGASGNSSQGTIRGWEKVEPEDLNTEGSSAVLPNVSDVSIDPKGPSVVE